MKLTDIFFWRKGKPEIKNSLDPTAMLDVDMGGSTEKVSVQALIDNFVAGEPAVQSGELSDDTEVELNGKVHNIGEIKARYANDMAQRRKNEAEEKDRKEKEEADRVKNEADEAERKKKEQEEADRVKNEADAAAEKERKDKEEKERRENSLGATNFEKLQKAANMRGEVQTVPVLTREEMAARGKKRYGSGK